MGFPGGSDGKESACNVGDLGLIPESGRSPGEGNGYPFQYSCLENSMDRGTWQAAIHGASELDMTEQLTVSRLPISQVSGLICSSKRSHLVSQSKEDSPPQLSSVASYLAAFPRSSFHQFNCPA